jgi:membrane protease YdiL (CAAX protease family)
VAATAVAFGLAHALTVTYAVLAALVGGYLGWLHLASGNLLVPVLAHALYDFIALRLLLRVKPTPTSSVL